MGTPQGERGRRAHEGPEHAVQITQAFRLGVFEVTQLEYEIVMEDNPSQFKQVAGMSTDRFPVEQVLYDEAIQFCKKLTALPEEQNAGLIYRLPTEAEWEYACRANTRSPFSCGSSLSSTQANFDGWHPYDGGRVGPNIDRTTTVGSYAPNLFGLYDMHGNVFEWVADWFDANYYKNSPRKDPQGPENGVHRTLRGGSWRNISSFLRSGERYFDRPARRHIDHGFRVACNCPA